MIIYLTRSHVKVFFGKGTAATYMPAMNTQPTMRAAPVLQSQTQYAPTAPPTLQYSPAQAPLPATAPATATGKCRSCGMPLAPGNTFCTNCGPKQYLSLTVGSQAGLFPEQTLSASEQSHHATAACKHPRVQGS